MFGTRMKAQVVDVVVAVVVHTCRDHHMYSCLWCLDNWYRNLLNRKIYHKSKKNI